MPVCATGSERQPGTPATITIDPLYAGSLLPPSLSWLLPFLPFMQPFTLDLDAFCDLEPPADPDITTADLIALLPGGSWNLASLAGYKLAQLVHIFAWYRFCRCIDLAAPDPFTPPDAPDDIPVINPPGYVAPYPAGGGICRTDILHLYTAAGGIGQSPLGVQVPPGATGYRYTAVIDSLNYNTFVAITFADTDDGNWDVIDNRVLRAINNGVYNQYPVDVSSNVTPLATLPAGSYVGMYIVKNGGGAGSGSASADVTLEWYCNGATPDDPFDYNPCVACPPDPFLTAMLSNLMARLEAVQLQVDLIQRQAVPFAYVEGDVHAGLTGAGQLAVSGLIGAMIEITDTLEPTIGESSGVPDYLWGAGWFNWGSADGYLPRTLLTSVTTLSLPASAGAYTLFAYSLAPGVEITVTELVREP